MKVRITTVALKLSLLQRAQLARRLAREFSRHSERMGSVAVRVSKHPVGKGKFEQHCRIDVLMSPKRLRVEESDPDLLVALTAAAQRAARSVARLIEGEHWPIALP